MSAVHCYNLVNVDAHNTTYLFNCGFEILWLLVVFRWVCPKDAPKQTTTNHNTLQPTSALMLQVSTLFSLSNGPIPSRGRFTSWESPSSNDYKYCVTVYQNKWI